MNPGILYALVAAAGLGAVTTQAKFVYEDGGNALTLMFWRFVISTLVIGVLVLVRRESFRIEPGLRKPAMLIGLIWSGAMICYLQSVQTISVSLAVLILYSYPILVLLVSVVSGRITPNAKILSAFAIAFLGLILMLANSEMNTGLIGIIFGLLAACGAAYTFFTGNYVASRMNPVVLAFWVNLAGIVLILPMMPGNFSMPESGFANLMLAGATLSFIVAIVSQFQALARIPAAKAALIFNFEPVVSIMLAGIVLGEMLSPVQWAGAAMVVGVLLCMGRIMGNSENNHG